MSAPTSDESRNGIFAHHSGCKSHKFKGRVDRFQCGTENCFSHAVRARNSRPRRSAPTSLLANHLEVGGGNRHSAALFGNITSKLYFVT